jgi:hypothetical protein
VRSSWDGRSRALLRIGLALIAGSTLLTLASSLAKLGVSAPILDAIVLTGLAAAALMALDRAPLGGSLVLLGSLALVAEWQTARLGAAHRRSFAVGATLLGWSIGVLWGRGLGARARDDLAEAGAVATLAATYVSAGMSKIFESGIDWANPGHLTGTILALHRVDATGVAAAWTAVVVSHPGVASALMAATLAIQLGAFAYVLHPTLRVIWGTLLIAFHHQVSLLTGIVYDGNVWLLLLFSYPWARLASAAPVPAPADPIVARRVLVAAIALTAAALALAWLLPIRAYTIRYD